MLIAIVVITTGVGLLSQWRESLQLRAEREFGRFEVAEWERLRAENLRLRQNWISPADLAALRADHAAVVRLRAELDALSHATARGSTP